MHLFLMIYLAQKDRRFILQIIPLYFMVGAGLASA